MPVTKATGGGGLSDEGDEVSDGAHYPIEMRSGHHNGADWQRVSGDRVCNNDAEIRFP